MIPILFAGALALAIQDQPPAESPPLSAEGPPSRDLSPAHDLFYEDLEQSTPEARATLQTFGACVADSSPELAARTLSLDFTTREYQNGLRRVTRANERCLRRRGVMRSANLLVAGAMAEHLLERGATPVNVQLAHAAARPAPRPASAADAIAICVVRSTPDDVARLFASDVASEAETAAARTLTPIVNLCNQTGSAVEINDAALRAMLATAAFRTVHVSEIAVAGE